MSYASYVSRVLRTNSLLSRHLAHKSLNVADRGDGSAMVWVHNDTATSVDERLKLSHDMLKSKNVAVSNIEHGRFYARAR